MSLGSVVTMYSKIYDHMLDTDQFFKQIHVNQISLHTDFFKQCKLISLL